MSGNGRLSEEISSTEQLVPELRLCGRPCAGPRGQRGDEGTGLWGRRGERVVSKMGAWVPRPDAHLPRDQSPFSAGHTRSCTRARAHTHTHTHTQAHHICLSFRLFPLTAGRTSGGGLAPATCSLLVQEQARAPCSPLSADPAALLPSRPESRFSLQYVWFAFPAFSLAFCKALFCSIS